jgi:acyl carrier protein
MMFVLHNFQIYDLEKVDWQKRFEDQGIDEYESTALITSIEHEFHTIFEDRVFENFENLNQVKQHLVLDHNAF